MSRTLRISRDLKKCKEDKATLETYFRTTAGEIRAKIKRRQERLQKMTEQARQMRMKAAEENARFKAAQKAEPGLTLGEHKADEFLQDLAAGKVKFAQVPPVTPSEHKATAGGRKTRRKRRRKKKKSRRKRKTRHRRKRRKTRKKRR